MEIYMDFGGGCSILKNILILAVVEVNGSTYGFWRWSD